ncbi:DUF4336 domain-containing protein [Rhodobacterales bacterium]|nr:DUF4336 domain-containing protein [Rhodobacterales bacterium]
MEVAENLWIFEGAIVPFLGCAYPTRCVIARLPSGALWVWSPTELTDDLKAEVEALGRPAHLVSPNKIHHLYLLDWKKVWPDAKIWAPASTQEKRDDLSFEPALDAEVPAEWEDQFDMVHFQGSFLVDELVFLHRASGTAIMADLSENFSQEFLKRHWKPWQRALANFMGIVEGRGYAPLDWRLSFLNRGKARKAKDAILGWMPERVIMAHGQWQDRNGTAYLQKSLSWL